MHNSLDQSSQRETAKNVTNYSLQNPGVLTAPVLPHQLKIYSNIDPNFYYHQTEEIISNSRKFLTLPSRPSKQNLVLSEINSNRRLSPDTSEFPEFRTPKFLAELTHIYSVPKKDAKITTLSSDNLDKPSLLDPTLSLSSPMMACSFVPSQCSDGGKCSQILGGATGQDLDCPPAPLRQSHNQGSGQQSQQKGGRSSKIKCPLCGLETNVDFMQQHMSECSEEGVCCSLCNEFVHKGILSHHKEYICAKRQVFCKSCGHNFLADQIQAHQSKCSLANKNWTNHSTPSSATLTRTANSDLSRISHASGSFCGEGGGSVTSGGGGGGNGGSSVGTGGSHGRPTVPGRSMPRAKSSDTFEHSGVRGAQLAPVDNNNAPGVCSSSSNQFMSSSVNPGGRGVHNGNPVQSPGLLPTMMDPGVGGNGYGSLFAKLEMLDKSIENAENPDEHVDHQSSVIISCIFRDAGCHFQGSHYALSRHLEESTKLHLAMTYSVMQHQQKQLLMVTSALAAAMNPNTDGNIIWKVRNFGERLMDAKSGGKRGVELQSAVFYSSRFGYKLCLLLYPDGLQSAKGSHLSIFIKVLRGDFDNYLQWPFPHTVKIAILSQDQSRQHIVQRVNHKFNALANESNSAASSVSSSQRNGSSSTASSTATNGHASRQHSASPIVGNSSGLIGLSRFVSQELILSSQQYLMDETLTICASVMGSDNNNNFKQPEVFPRTSEI
ncbi:uncharacterized protein LOC134854209 isoform X2 [Symsagittifera roscoffensis]|uniref:uncharacterized protein LOC134854209 isoform X2 n=1 Tax=Symsagittifera roscoffensis TaxID=84072 RepID=UPI00307B7E68